MNQQSLHLLFQFIVFNFQFSIFKGAFSKFSSVILFFFTISLTTNLVAQTGCPDCEIALPDSIGMDTFYLQEFPDGEFRAGYDKSITYRLPTNTSQLLFLLPDLPAGIGIGKLSIKSINNLPAGLSWEPNQKSYDLPDERDGCIRICGTPLQFGLFQLEITVTAQVSILNQDATFTRNIFIAPSSTTNSGFTMTNNVGCGNTTVSFENNNPSNGQDGFNYNWNFGLGSTTSDENPIPQNYTEPGVYPVSYQAIIDTVGYILTEVKVLETDCSDFLGKPDLKLKITNGEGVVVFENEAVQNLDPPITFPLSLDILSGNYQLEVLDGDSGLNGQDDVCGTINFNQLSSGELSDGDLKVSISIFHPVDTIDIVDSVVVYEIPTSPIISFDGNFIFCEGDSLELSASALSNTQQWYRDSTPINAATEATLKITEPGAYYISTISEEGCINTSSMAFLAPIPVPSAPVLKQEGNLLSIFNPAILPDPYSLRWFQEGNLLDHTAFSLCISETGKYGIELTNSTSGCSNFFESVYSFDETGICSTPTEDLATSIDHIKIYPNPVATNLRIDLQLNEALSNGTISLVNLLGQRLAFQQITNSNTEQHIEFDMERYPTGLYIIQLESDRKVSSWKVLKQ